MHTRGYYDHLIDFDYTNVGFFMLFPIIHHLELAYELLRVFVSSQSHSFLLRVPYCQRAHRFSRFCCYSAGIQYAENSKKGEIELKRNTELPLIPNKFHA